MTKKKKVLLIGIDPKLIDFSKSTTTGWDANRVQTAGQDANKRLVELGYEVQSCLVDLREETAASVVSDILSREKFDCIMIGAGIRALPQHTLLFEKIINTIHQKAPPSSKICFNTNPSDTVEAVLRWIS
jgi:protein-L-isoaspartate O-methyltransferase